MLDKQRRVEFVVSAQAPPRRHFRCALRASQPQLRVILLHLDYNQAVIKITNKERDFELFNRGLPVLFELLSVHMMVHVPCVVGGRQVSNQRAHTVKDLVVEDVLRPWVVVHTSVVQWETRQQRGTHVIL